MILPLRNFLSWERPSNSWCEWLARRFSHDRRHRRQPWQVFGTLYPSSAVSGCVVRESRYSWVYVGFAGETDTWVVSRSAGENWRTSMFTPSWRHPGLYCILMPSSLVMALAMLQWLHLDVRLAPRHLRTLFFALVSVSSNWSLRLNPNIYHLTLPLDTEF